MLLALAWNGESAPQSGQLTGTQRSVPNKLTRSFAEKRGGRTSRTCVKVNLQRLRLAPKGHGAVILEIVDTVGVVLEGIDGGSVCVRKRSSAGYPKELARKRVG